MKQAKILLVDDFNSNILYLTRLLQGEGHEIHSGNNAEHALQLVSCIEFDLILLDIVMPGTDGFTLCEWIRKSTHNVSTPVIFITSKNDEKSILKGFDIGAQDYIIRPFNNSELLARVNTHIELKRSRVQLKEMNATLEKTVNKRTKELKAALTKLKRSYKKLKVAQKELLTLDKAKESFLSIINHEIRTPLNGIIGFQELIKVNFKDENLINYLEMMQASVDRLEKFSMNALLITQLKAGMYQLDVAPVNIRHLIGHIINQFMNRISMENINICIDIQDADIYTDENLYKYTLNGLLENALYHTPSNQSIRIRGEKVGNFYQIEFMDEGNGFPPEMIDNNYRLFFNDKFTDNRPGLSLFTISLIMKCLKGKLQLTNNPDGGASALVKLKSLAD